MVRVRRWLSTDSSAPTPLTSGCVHRGKEAQPLPGSLIAGSFRWSVALSTLAAAATLSVLPVGSTLSTASAAPDGPDLAPVIGRARETAIEGKYVVVLQDDTSTGEAAAAEETVADAGGDVERSFDTALTGFTAELDDDAVAALREDPAVAYIEADQRVEAWGTESHAPWGWTGSTSATAGATAATTSAGPGPG